MFCSVTPICSAIDMNRLLKISSITGSAVRADGAALRQRHDAGQHEVVERGERGLPAILDDDGLVRLDDERWTGDDVTGHELVAQVNTAPRASVPAR